MRARFGEKGFETPKVRTQGQSSKGILTLSVTRVRGTKNEIPLFRKRETNQLYQIFPERRDRTITIQYNIIVNLSVSTSADFIVQALGVNLINAAPSCSITWYMQSD